ncbi:hypothetical protein MCEMSE6_01420 [Oxalobacteraceae bacterium]
MQLQSSGMLWAKSNEVIAAGKGAALNNVLQAPQPYG